MSVTLMSAVFHAKIATTQDGDKKVTSPVMKLVLLALADHANEDGDGAYPSQSRIERFTGLTHSSVNAALRVLQNQGYITKRGESNRGTTEYSIDAEKLVRQAHRGSALGALGSSATRTGNSAPSVREPSVTVNEPPNTQRAKDHPELVLFRSVTNRWPPRPNFEDVIASISKVSVRLRRPATRDDLMPFYAAWTARDYKPHNLAWLEWAVAGKVPQNGRRAANLDAIREWAGKP